MEKTILKKLSLFLILSLLMMSVGPPAVKGVENPYGKKTWRWRWAFMEIIHDNGSALIVKRDGEPYEYMEVEVVSEEKGWAEIKVTWKGRDFIAPGNYWNDHDIPDVDHLTFMVKKSTNVAYFKKTDEVFGFNPFYIFNYTDASVLDGKKNVVLDLHRKIIADYGSWNNRPGFNNFESEKMITEVRNPETNYTRRYKRWFVNLDAKGHYPVNMGTLIPAEYLINNVTTERYVRISVMVEEENTEAWEFLESINTSAGANTDQDDEVNGDPSSTNYPTSILIAGIAVFASIAGYLGYRKQRER